MNRTLFEQSVHGWCLISACFVRLLTYLTGIQLLENKDKTIDQVASPPQKFNLYLDGDKAWGLKMHRGLQTWVYFEAA